MSSIYLFLITVAVALKGHYVGLDDKFQPLTNATSCYDSYQCMRGAGSLSNVSYVVLSIQQDGICQNKYNIKGGSKLTTFSGHDIYSQRLFHCNNYNYCAAELCKSLVDNNITVVILKHLKLNDTVKDLYQEEFKEKDQHKQKDESEIIAITLSTVASIIAFLFSCVLIYTYCSGKIFQPQYDHDDNNEEDPIMNNI